MFNKRRLSSDFTVVFGVIGHSFKILFGYYPINIKFITLQLYFQKKHSDQDLPENQIWWSVSEACCKLQSYD